MTPLAIPPLPVTPIPAHLPVAACPTPTSNHEVPCFVEESVLQSMIAMGRQAAEAIQWTSRETTVAQQEWCLPR